MGDVVVYLLLLLSEAYGPIVDAYPTPEACLEARAAIQEIVEQKAPELGDAVYLGECQEVTLKRYTKSA